MFGRKKDNQNVEQPVEAQPLPKGYTPPKGRKTPTRKEAQAANQRPLVPKDRKKARQIDRAERDRLWQLEQDALRTGDEKHLPRNHRGPQKRYLRDYIDARFCLAEGFIPAAIVMLVVSFFTTNPNFGHIASNIVLAIYIYMLVAFIDGLSACIRAVAFAKLKFDTMPKWSRMYAFLRCLYLRPLRIPKPQVKRNQFPS